MNCLFYFTATIFILFFQRLLTSFVNKLFTPESFDADFVLVNNVEGQQGKNIIMPEGVR